MEDTSIQHHRLKYLTQIFGALAISLVSISDGCVHGYSTIALPQLESNETDSNLQLTENEGKHYKKYISHTFFVAICWFDWERSTADAKDRLFRMVTLLLNKLFCLPWKLRTSDAYNNLF